MVKLLPSDVARLVLAYLQGNNLKNASQKFLEESPDLEEVRQNPECPVLPPLAKDLEAILEEHATFIQDGKKKTQVNPLVIQLWRKLDAIVAQLKYEYLQEKLPPPQMKGVNNYLHNQRVRSRLSLNALRSQQKQGRGQANLGESSTSASSPSDGRTLPRNSDQDSSESHEGTDGTLTQQSSDQDYRNDTDQLPDACQPSTSGTQREPVRSPKRKSITPRKKYSPEDLIPVRKTASQDTAASAPRLYPEELIEFPQILESLLSDQTLPEKLAGTINKVLPNTEFSHSSSLATEESTTTTVASSLRTMDEGSVMDRRALEEVIEMASSDPAFDSLFSLFNVEREKFLEEEKKRLIAQPASDGATDPSMNDSGNGSRPSTCVPRQLFQLELKEKQTDPPSQKDVESSDERQAENRSERQVESNNERQAESSNEKLTFKAETSEAEEPVEEKSQRKDVDSSGGESQGGSDEIVEMETESISTSPAAQVEKLEADFSYIDVETTERDSPSPLEETTHQSKQEASVTDLERPDPAKGHVSEEEVNVTDIKRPDPSEGHLSEEDVDVTDIERPDPTEGHQFEEEVDVTKLDRPDPSECHLSEEEVDVTDIERPDPTEGHQFEEEVDVTKLERPDHAEGYASEEEVNVTELETSDPAEDNMSGKNAAQRLSNAAQEESLQSKGVSGGSNASQNQIAAEKEQKDDEASTGDKGKKVRRRRRDRTTCSQGTRRSQRLEAKKKENFVPEGSPHSNQREGDETPVMSPVESKISLTESSLVDRAKTPILEAANEYAKKVLASMADGTSNKPITSDVFNTVTTNVIVTTGDKQSVSSGNVNSQSDVSLMVTSSGGKKCTTVASFTNTTATVLSTRQNAEITTTKSRASKGKVTVMAPPGVATYPNGSQGINRKDTGSMGVETGGGKSEKNWGEFAQPQSMAGSSNVSANLKKSSVGSVGMEIGSGAHSKVHVTSNSTTSLENNVSISSRQATTGDNSGSRYHGTQNAISTATSLQGATRTAYMPPATSVSSTNNTYSSYQNVQAHQQVTAQATNNPTSATDNHFVTVTMDAPQGTQGLQYATRLDTNVQNLSGNQFIPASASHNIQPQQQAVGLAANTQNASNVQYVPISIQAGENPAAGVQAASNVIAGNISREQYGPGSNTSYSIAGAQTSTLPLLVYNPTALQGTNIVPGSLNLQSSSVGSGNQGSVVLYPVENSNNRTFQLVQSNPGSSGILGNPQIITLQAADGLLSLSGAVQNAVPSSEIGQTPAIPQKASGSKMKRKASKKSTSQNEVNSRAGHSNVDASGNSNSAAPLTSPNSLPPAQHQAILHGATVSHDHGLDAKRSETQKVQKKSSGLSGSDVVPERQLSGSNHLNLDNQGVATLINEELERSLENASTQDIDFIFKAITMTPQKEPAPSDCAKYSPLDKAIADKLKQFAVGTSNQDSSTETQNKEQPSPLKKAAMQMQGEMLRNKKCVRKVFSDEGSFDERLVKDARVEKAERTANISNVTENGNRTTDHSREEKKYVLDSSQIMNGFVPTSTLPANHVRSHSHALHTSLPDALGPIKMTPSLESEKRLNKSDSYEGSKRSEGHQVRQDRNAPSAGERQHRSHQNGAGHYSQNAVGLQENTTVSKCNKEGTHKMEERLKPKDFKYKIDLEKKQKLEKRMRTRLKKENLEIKSERGLESKDKNKIHKGTDLRTSENASITNRHGGKKVAEEFVNERGTNVNGERGDSEGRRVERPAQGGRENVLNEREGDNLLHGRGPSSDIKSDDRGRDRVSHPGGQASGSERRRDEELERTSGHGKQLKGHNTVSKVKDEKMSGVSEGALREGDDGGDNLWSRIDRVMNDKKWVERRDEDKSGEKSSRNVEEETDSLQQEESCSRTEGYKRMAKRNTPESKMRLVASGGRVSDNERGHGMGEVRRRKELAGEEKLRENENRLREVEGSKSVGVHQERTKVRSLGENNHTDGNLNVSGRSPYLEEKMKDRRCGEQVRGLKVGGTNTCSTPKEKSEETPVSGQVKSEYSSSTQARLRGESVQNVTEKGFVENGTCIENLDESDKVPEQRFQNENKRRMREFHEEPDVSPILADEDVSSFDEDESYNEEIDSCSRTRIHYSKTNSKWNKPRAESSRVIRSNDAKTGEQRYCSPQTLVNGPSPIASSGSNNRRHSVDDRVKESTRFVNSPSDLSEADNRSLMGRLQASGREGSGSFSAGPSRVGVPGPRSGRENETKRTSVKATKRPSEDDKDVKQEKKKRKKRTSGSVDDFPSDFDLQKFFAKLKYA